MIRATLLGATTFFFIFGWKINELADLILLTSLALIAYSFFHGHIFADQVSIRVTTSLGLLCIYSLLIVLLNGIFDAQIALRSLRALINFLGALSLTSIYFERSQEHFLGNLLRDIYLALAFHAGLMLCMYMNSMCRTFIYQLTGAHSIVNISTPFLDGLRICGLTYGLSQTSVLQMLGLLLLPIVLENCKSTVSRLMMLAGAPLLVLSILISGRSGLMIGLLFLPLYLASLLLRTDEASSPAKIATRMVKNLSGLLLIGLALFLLFSLLPQKFSSYSWEQASEVFSAFQLRGPTIANLSDMFFLPESWFELLFGSSNLGRGSLENIPSDVGWVKTIFAIGLTGTLLGLAPYLYALRLALRVRVVNSSIAIISFMVFSSAILLNCKEMALLTRNQWSVHALLLTALCLKLQQVKPAEKRIIHAVQ